MKSAILTTTIAALFAAAPLHAEAPAANSSASSSVTTSSDGTATVTIEVNGKKETRTFKLGEDGRGSLSVPTSPVPSATAAKQMETWIGIGIGGPISEAIRAQLPIAEGEGISVSHVAPGSPAAQAGLAQHDILVRLDEQILVTGEQFKKLIRMRKTGDTVKLGYFRKGERQETTVTLGEHVAEPAHTFTALGESLKDITPEKWQDRLKLLREKSGDWRERLQEAKEKFPGVIVETRAFLEDADGTVRRIESELKSLQGVLREELEKANIPQETIEQVRKALESSLDKAAEATRRTLTETLRELRPRKPALPPPATENGGLEPLEQPAPPNSPIQPAR